MKIYKYIGDGAGIPGLPHEISEDEAAQYSEQFKAALAAGLYQLVGAQHVAPEIESPKRKQKKADEPAEGD